MNVVHAVLRNWDILQVIINSLKDGFSRPARQRDVAAVALVCRALSDLALNVLWRDIRVENIYFLFPMEIIRVHPEGTKSLTRIPATSREWERFDVYASRIRSISASPSPNHLFLCGCLNRYPAGHYPFPNLTCLHWSSRPSDLVDVIALICPTLADVLLSIDGLGANSDEDDDAVTMIFGLLGETCPRLKKFDYVYHCIPGNGSKAVETSLIRLIRRCRLLEDVRLPVSRNVLRSMASLPHLSALRLDYTEWEDESQLYLPIEADKWIAEANRFLVLDDLTIQGWHTVSSLTESFQGSGCFPRRSFTMLEMCESDEWSTLAMTDFFRGILRPDRSEGLLVFTIERESPEENIVEHDLWQALRSLSFIPNIHTLTLDGLFLDVDDADLEEILRIWPKLQSLSLDVPYTDDYQSRISFQGLAHLSTLKNLENVSLMLAPESTISESMLSPSMWSNSRLEYITIRGKFPPVTPYAAAMFLILHFPRLKRIKNFFLLDNGEIERMKAIQTLLDGFRPMAKNLWSVRRSLRSGTRVDQEGGED